MLKTIIIAIAIMIAFAAGYYLILDYIKVKQENAELKSCVEFLEKQYDQLKTIYECEVIKNENANRD